MASSDAVQSFFEAHSGPEPDTVGDPVEVFLTSGKVNSVPSTSKESPGWLDKIMGPIDAATTLARGALAGPIGGIAGFAKTLTGGKYGTQEGVEEGAQFGSDIAKRITGQPGTQTGQSILEGISKAFDASKLAGLNPSTAIELQGMKLRPGKVPQVAAKEVAAKVEAPPLQVQSERASVLQRVGIDQARESSLTGDAKAGASDFQQSKIDNPGGNLMRTVFDKEKQALQAHTEKIAQDAGGTLGMSEDELHARGVTIAQPFDSIRDVLNTTRKELYKQADTAAGNSLSVSLRNPNDLIPREMAQNSLSHVRELFPNNEYFPIVAIRSDKGLEIIDGHNRTVVASERGHKIPVVEIGNSQYESLKKLGFDDIEISYASLMKAEQHDAAESLNQQFRGADVERRGLEALGELNSLGEITLNSFSKFMKKDSEFEGKAENGSLRKGINSYLREQHIVNDDGSLKPISAQSAEGLRQYINSQWSPSTSGLAGRIKGLIDNDVLDKAGTNIYQPARELHKKIKDTLENPSGISKLMDSDPRNPVNRAVPYEKVPDFVSRLPVDQFQHVIGVLKNAPAELKEQAQSAIGEIKSHIVNKILNEGTKQQGQWNSKGVSKLLNDNKAKIESLFTPEEAAKLSDLDEAGKILRVDQSYPGAAVQQHNLLIRGAMSVIPTIGSGVGGILGPVGAVGGKVAGDVLSHKLGAKGSLSAAQKRLVNLSDMVSPSSKSP